MIRVTENYRPKYNGDHILLTIENIDNIESCPSKYLLSFDFVCTDDKNFRMIFHGLDVKQIPDLVRDFVVLRNIPTPCNISIYGASIESVEYLPRVISELLDLGSDSEST